MAWTAHSAPSPARFPAEAPTQLLAGRPHPVQEARVAARFRLRVEAIARQPGQLVGAQDGLAQDPPGDGVAQPAHLHGQPRGLRPAARGLGHLVNEVAELGPIGTDRVDRVVVAGGGCLHHEAGVVLDVDRADPVRRSVRYRYERQATGGPGDVVDEAPARAEEACRPQDGEAQAALAHELLDDGLAGEVRQVGVQARVGDGCPDEPLDAGPCRRLDERGRLIDGLQVRQPWPPVPDGRLVVPAPEVRHEHPAAAQFGRETVDVVRVGDPSDLPVVRVVPRVRAAVGWARALESAHDSVRERLFAASVSAPSPGRCRWWDSAEVGLLESWALDFGHAPRERHDFGSRCLPKAPASAMSPPFGTASSAPLWKN